MKFFLHQNFSASLEALNLPVLFIYNHSWCLEKHINVKRGQILTRLYTIIIEPHKKQTFLLLYSFDNGPTPYYDVEVFQRELWSGPINEVFVNKPTSTFAPSESSNLVGLLTREYRNTYNLVPTFSAPSTDIPIQGK